MLILRNIAHLVVNAHTVLENVDLLVEDGHILDIGRRLKAPPDAETLDCAGCAVLPGFVNAHTHLYQTLLAGRRDDLPLSGWCDRILVPCINALYAEPDQAKRERRAYVWTAVGICEMLRSGVTTFLDMDLNYGQDGMFQAANDANIRGYFGVELADRFLPDDETGLAQDFREIDRLLAAHPGNCVLTPSEPNLCSDEALRRTAELIKQSAPFLQIHVDETAAEAKQCISERGCTELELLDRFGFLTPWFSAVHGVHLSEREIRLAALYGVTVVFNPKSNAKLGSGVCPVPALREAGIHLALATDGPASNDRLDLFEEMRAGVLTQKSATKDASSLTAQDVFHMATRGGARMLMLDAGKLKKGSLADFSVVPLNKARFSFGTGDTIATLVYCAQSGDVRDVYVGGKPALRDGRVVGLDEAALEKEFANILSELKEYQLSEVTHAQSE